MPATKDAAAAGPDARAETASTTPAFSPLYQQIKGLLLRSLQAGEWQPGQAIPSEVDLALRFRVSQGTVRKAIDEMANENLLVRRQGKGTFVSTHAEEQTRYRFLRLAPDAGGLPNLARRMLHCRRMRSTAEVARAAAGMSRRDADVLVRKLVARYQPELNQRPVGQSFTEVYDPIRVQPRPAWLETYEQVKSELREMGLALS